MREPITGLRAETREREAAAPELVPLVYEDLRKLARSYLRRGHHAVSLDTTGLVHEAYLKLVDRERVPWKGRGHFLAVSAMAMRQILVDRARLRSRPPRGGGAPGVSLDVAEPAARGWERLLDVDLALEKLGVIDARLVRVVECRYFAGLSEQETAAALGVSLRTAQREWLKARAWLRREIGGRR